MIAQRTRPTIEPLTVDDVLAGTISDYHDNVQSVRRDGSCYSWRTNGRLQRWVTRPRDFRQPVKYGMYQYGAITPDNVGSYHDGAKCDAARRAPIG